MHLLVSYMVIYIFSDRLDQGILPEGAPRQMTITAGCVQRTSIIKDLSLDVPAAQILQLRWLLP